MLSKKAKKRLGQLVKKLDRVQPRIQIPNLINCGQQVDGEYFKNWWLFKGNNLEEVKLAMYREGIPIYGYSIDSIYDCTGQRFYYEADFKVFEERVFVTQSGGLDV